MITTQSDWRAAYAKVDSSLTALLGPASADQPAAAAGVAGAVGTAGSGLQMDPAIRGKLVEFRTHLKAFETAAGGGAMAPGASPDATANPANPTPANPANPASAASAANPPSANPTSANPASATPANPPSGVTPSSPTTSMAPADQAKASDQVGRAEAEKHLDAISKILDASKTGALTKAQTAQLKEHVAALRQALQQK